MKVRCFGILLLCVLAAESCSRRGGGGEPLPAATPAPTQVVSTYPSDGALGVSVHTGITVLLSRQVAPDEVTLELSSSGKNIGGTLTYQDNSITFKPVVTLGNFEAHEVRLGGALEKHWHFTTEGLGLPFAVASHSPTANQSGVPIHAAIKVVLSQPVNPASIGPDTLVVSDPDGPVAGKITVQNAEIQFTPDVPMATLTLHSVRLENNFLSLGGKAIEQPLDWSFTTDEFSPPLTLESFFPDPGAVDVPLAGLKIQASFSQNLDPDTVNPSTIQINDSGGMPMPGLFTVNGPDLEWSPTRFFAGEETYYILISKGVTDLAGTPLDQSFQGSFQTEVLPPVDCTTQTQIIDGQSGTHGTWMNDDQYVTDSLGNAFAVGGYWDTGRAPGQDYVLWTNQYRVENGIAAWEGQRFLEATRQGYRGFPPNPRATAVLDEQGRVTVIWTKSLQSDGSGPPYELHSLRFDPDSGTWSDFGRVGHAVPGQGYLASNPGRLESAVDPQGNIMVVWFQEVDSRLGGDDQGSVWARYYDATAGQWDPTGPVLLETDTIREPRSDLVIAGDDNGNFLVAWIHGLISCCGSNEQVLYARNFEGSNKAWNASGLLRFDDLNPIAAMDPSLAVQPSGETMVVWAQVVPAAQGGDDLYSIYARPFDLNLGTWQGQTTLLESIVRDSCWQPQVAVNSRGDYLVLFNSVTTDGASLLDADLFSVLYDSSTGSWDPAGPQVVHNHPFVVGHYPKLTGFRNWDGFAALWVLVDPHGVMPSELHSRTFFPGSGWNAAKRLAPNAPSIGVIDLIPAARGFHAIWTEGFETPQMGILCD